MAKAKDHRPDLEIKELEHDLLGWRNPAQRLAQYLVDTDHTPLVVGIQGSWGSGKTSFIRLVEASLRHEHVGSAPPQPVPPINRQHDKKEHSLSLADRLHHYHLREAGNENGKDIYFLWFNSWIFDQSSYAVDDLFPIYIAQAIEDYLTQEKRLGEIGHEVSKRFKRLLRSVGAGMGDVVKVALPVFGEAGSKMVDKLLELTDTEETKLIAELPGSKQKVQELIDQLLDHEAANRLIVVVDDLDRIPSTKAISVMEKLKVFFDVEGIMFLLTADLEVLEQGIRYTYGSGAIAGDGKNYLDKVVKVRYYIPVLKAHDLLTLMRKYETFCQALDITGMSDHDVEVGKVFALLHAFPGIGGNIRAAKLVMLTFEFLLYILNRADKWGEKKNTMLLAVIIIYQYDPNLAKFFYIQFRDNLGRTQNNENASSLLADKRIAPRTDIANIETFNRIALSLSGSGEEWEQVFDIASSVLNDVKPAEKPSADAGPLVS